MDIDTATHKCIEGIARRERTKEAYIRGLGQFKVYLEEQGIKRTDPVESITVDHFVYFYGWVGKNHTLSTIGVYTAAAKKFLKWLVIGNVLQPDYHDTIRLELAAEEVKPDKPTRNIRFPKTTDVPRLLDAARVANSPTPRRERNIALFEFLSSTGCRISEATQLNIRDLDFTDRTAEVVGKGGYKRTIIFSESAENALKTYWSARKSESGTDPIFARHDRGAGKRVKRMTPQTARMVVKELKPIAKVKKWSPHYFRHAFAIQLLHQTHDLALVQDELGHRRADTTRIYAKINMEDRLEARKEDLYR